MEPLELPAALGKIEIPLHLSVTRLAASGPCLLRAVTPRSLVPRSSAGPYAEFGKLVHTLTELAITGQLGSNGIPADVADAFQHLLLDAARRLSLDEETKAFADLTVAFTKAEWEKRRFLALSEAENLRTRLTVRPADFALPRAERLSLARFLEGKIRDAAEVPFESATLRLRGRLDFITLMGDEVTVSDFKSGRVADQHGTLDALTSRQLRLYALAILELAPQKRVSLRVIDRGGETFEAFDEAAKETTSKWLRTTTDRLTRGAHVEAETLAVIGPQCRRCDVRPVCPAYRRAVPDLWKHIDTPFELPLDIAGGVLDCNRQADGYLTLKMIDLADRVVKIHRLAPRRLSRVAPAQDLWIFDLASIEARMQRTGWRQPRNFHEIAMMPTERTAWTLRVFTHPQGRDPRI